jgi:hypothetical protein
LRLLTDALFLVPVAVTLLGELLFTVATGVRPRTNMSPHMIFHIGKLAELLGTNRALEVLVHTLGALVDFFEGFPKFLWFFN